MGYNFSGPAASLLCRRQVLSGNARLWAAPLSLTQRHVDQNGPRLIASAVPNKSIIIRESVSSLSSYDSLGSSDRGHADCVEAQPCGDKEAFQENYGALSIADIVRERTTWLAVFAVGLLMAAGVVEEFDDLISKHVELSFFVPLIMGHGGNTGSQTTCAVIRALALKQVCFKDAAFVVGKEAAAGCCMGGLLGVVIFILSLVTHAVSPDVGLAVAVALPVISLWANGLGAFLTLGSARLNMDPALTSAPLVTTIVDTTGLVIYFVIASNIVGHGKMVQAAMAVLESSKMLFS